MQTILIVIVIVMISSVMGGSRYDFPAVTDDIMKNRRKDDFAAMQVGLFATSGFAENVPDFMDCVPYTNEVIQSLNDTMTSFKKFNHNATADGFRSLAKFFKIAFEGCGETTNETRIYLLKVLKYFGTGANVVKQLKDLTMNGFDFLASITLANRAIDEDNDYYVAGKQIGKGVKLIIPDFRKQSVPKPSILQMLLQIRQQSI